MELLDNIDLIHTTVMGMDRIKKNIGFYDLDILKNMIKSKNANIYKQGKNWYVEVDEIRITVNSYSYTIITCHKL